ncbi:unnamed protein product [Spirodela intermedia]|uniref:Uncharacterized protein n=1 Tax=Spirodela intermedia TaxID=51605 RepID=A0A7I8LEJ9_SPIIN|nr:unnamed protein product [Spirodela intermedia]
MGRRRWTASWFRRPGSPAAGDGDAEAAGNRKDHRSSVSWRRFRLVFSSSVWRWRRPDFRLTILDDVVFFVLSIIEAIVLVAVFCFYFCRFGSLI